MDLALNPAALASRQIAICAILATSSFAQPVFRLSEANWIRRQACSIVTPKYVGPCVFTVTTDGGGKGLNIHFDLSENGDQGVTWVVYEIEKQTKDVAFLKTKLVVTRFPDLKEYALNGSCSVAPEAFRCLTDNGQFQSHATGIVQ